MVVSVTSNVMLLYYILFFLFCGNNTDIIKYLKGNRKLAYENN